MNAAERYAHSRQRGIAAGTWLFDAPAGPVRAHIDHLIRAGMTTGQIARAAGVDISTVRRVRQHQTVRGSTAVALLAVVAAPAGPRAGLVSALGTCRRLQALVALGWSFPQQAQRLGVTPQRVRELALLPTGAAVAVETKWAVTRMFEQLSATPGGSTKAYRYAARMGWLPPLAWDDLDDPDAHPDLGDNGAEIIDEVAVERALAGGDVALADAELIAAVTTGVARGSSLTCLASTLGVDLRLVRRLAGGELPAHFAARARRRTSSRAA